MYTNEEVREATLKYFNGDQLATDVFMSKYCLKDQLGNFYEKSPDDMHRRIAKEFARIEQKYNFPLSEEEIYQLLKGFKYIVPQGSPMFGIGNNFHLTSLSNCFFIGSNGDSDSYGSIMRTDEEIAQIYKRRGGCGIDLSHYRPSGAVSNSAILGEDCGATLYMERFSNTTREVSQNGRRGALMESMLINHPDAEKFIDMKMEKGKVTGANISVKITDEFMEAVKGGTEFFQTFPTNLLSDPEKFNKEFPKSIDEYKLNNLYRGESGKTYLRKINAKKLWDKIIKNAWGSAEPGILFWSNFVKESTSEGYEGHEIRGVNPCAEICLPDFDSCRLMLLNLYSYVDRPFEKGSTFNYKKFIDHVFKAQKLMDDLVDLEIEKIEAIIKKIENDPESEDIKRVELNLWKNILKKAEGRRTGLGVTAEGDMLAALGLRYGTPEATDFSEKVHKIMAVESYKASIVMAVDRGSFNFWDYNKEKENPFITRILEELDERYVDSYNTFGRRNIANLTIAPAGSCSIMTQTTSGVEPVFLPYYKRKRKVDKATDKTIKDEVGDNWEEYFVFHHKFIIWFDKNWYKLDYGWYDKDYKPDIETLSEEKLEEIYKKSPYYKATSNDVNWVEKIRMQGRVQKWVDHSISVTVNIPKETPVSVVDQIYLTAHEVGCKGCTIYRDGSRFGVLTSSNDKKEEGITYNNAPKRPKDLECDIYTKTALGKDFTVIVGMLNDRPYEVFAFEQLSQQDFPKDIKRGKISKIRKQHYRLFGIRNNKDFVVDNIVNLMEDDERTNTRRYSLQLRHGIKPMFIHEQIEKYANVTSFDKVISRVLKNYTNGSRNKCGKEGCEGTIAMQDGCEKCIDCGWTAC